ncbi:MAG: chorismate mutase [Clostridia bacterium]|nr:chorismate mutase [Clostridia bacterium]
MIENLDEVRARIDRIDDDILSRFLERMKLSEQVAEYKAERNMPVEDTQREYEIVEHVAECSGEFSTYTTALFRAMLELSKDYQEHWVKAYNEDEKRKVVQMPGVYGLLGQHLEHSYSEQIHKELGLRGRVAYDYRLLDVDPEELETFITRSDIAGLNVTMPYKTAILAFCQELSDDVLRIGAANTVVMKKGKLHAYNTDIAGFKYMVERANINIAGKKCIILGNGGTSKAARCALEDLGAREIVILSREGFNDYEALAIHFDAEIVVNATPVGMYPDNLEKLVSLKSFPRCCAVIDVIYNPLRTALLLEAEELGIPHVGGLSMLVAQARESYNLFFDRNMINATVEDVTTMLYKQNENIILTGMPGCGKTTIAEAIGEATGREVIDIDKVIELEQKKSVAEIINKYGEETFRNLEHAAIVENCKESGKVIALGGGAILDRNNYPALHQNGKIFFIRRDISLLPTDDRPLSKSPETLMEMQKIRLPLYQDAADVEIENNGTIEEAVEKILKAL